MKNITIAISNYIPPKGYFELIASVDKFILYDDMECTRWDWRHPIRSRGEGWRAAPVRVKGKRHHKIPRDTERRRGMDGFALEVAHPE
jgi:WbqC-like protein family